MRASSPPPLLGPEMLTVRGLVKHYGNTRALDGVDLVVHAGQVHCVVGQNGAGKSTLIRCVSGIVTPTHGTIAMDGRVLPGGDPTAAFRAGIAAIYQELDLVDSLTVAENIFLGHERSTAGVVNRRRARADSYALFERLGHDDVDPDSRVGALRPATKQLVSIARALSRDARLLIMDEPSAVFDRREVDALFAVVDRLIAEHVGIIYVSHRLDEVARIGHTVTVLKDGRTVAGGLSPSEPGEVLVGHMVGKPATTLQPVARRSPVDRGGSAVLSVRGLTRRPDVVDVDLDVYAGEIVGIAGLVGAGRTELLRLIYGLEHAEHGSVTVDGRQLRAGRSDRAVAAGLALAPEERKSQGLWAEWSLTRNVTIADLASFRTGPRLDVKRERETTRRHLQSLGTRPTDPERLVRELSGGNQQKVVLARWLTRDCRVLLLDEPTRGVDVGAKEELYAVVRDLAARGIGVVVVSSELNELERLCDRVVVMSDGRLVAELEGDEITEAEIVRRAVAIPAADDGFAT